MWIIVFVLASVAPSVGAEQAFDFASHLRIMELDDSGTPEIIGTKILFSYRPDLPIRHVGIAFAHESFSRVHDFTRTAQGIYVYLYAPEASVDRVAYRFVVDGMWITDPDNPQTIIDSTGTVMSVFRFSGVFPEALPGPRVSGKGEVELYYYGAPGKRIYLTGDFTNWEPFLYRLVEFSPGSYRFSLPMPPGVHRYQFIVDGATVIDPLNPEVVIRGDGRRVSVLVVN
jgi:hypothetical protein